MSVLKIRVICYHRHFNQSVSRFPLKFQPNESNSLQVSRQTSICCKDPTTMEVSKSLPSSSSSSIKQRLKTTYDAVTLRYIDWSQPSRSILVHYLELLLQHLAKSPNSPEPTINVLELGCGAGVPVTQHLTNHSSPHNRQRHLDYPACSRSSKCQLDIH